MANRNYRIYTLCAIPSLIGTWVQRMAVGWFAWELTGSGTWLGLVAFADLAPAVVVAPVAGAFADRVDRLKAVRFVQYAHMFQATGLALFTLAGWMTIERLFCFALLQGALQGIHQPFRQALVGTIVDRREIAAAIGINSTIWNSSRMIGPAISAMIILYYGVGVTFVVNALSYVPMLAGLYLIVARQQISGKKSLMDVPSEILEGVRHVAGHRLIGPLLVLLFAVSFFGRAVAELLPGFAGAVFGMNADGLAMLTAGAGFGSLLSGIWLSRRGRLRGLGDILISSLFLIFVTQTAFAASPDIATATAVFVVWGFLLNACGIIVQSLVQAEVPDSIRGRVVSLYGILWLGTPAVGAFIMGAIADFVGFRWPVAIAAAAILAAFAWSLALRQRFRREIANMTGR